MLIYLTYFQIIFSYYPYGNPLQCSYLENFMNGGAWWAVVHRVLKSQMRLTHTHYPSWLVFTDTLLNCFWGLFIIRIIQHLEWESLIISSYENTNWLWIIANKALLTLIVPSLLKTRGQYFNLIDCTTVHTIFTTDYNQLTISNSKIGSRLSYK